MDKTKKKKTKQKLPVIPTSLLEPEDDPLREDDQATPPISYAQVINEKFKKPKIPIPQRIIDENPEDNLVDNSTLEDDLNDHQRNLIEEAIKESARIIGFSPITEQMKNIEAEKIRKNGQLDGNRDKSALYETATKNLVDKFMRNKLKMDANTRRLINIVQIYSSQSDNSPTIYIKCKSDEDVSTITSHAHNLPRPDRDTIADTLVPHIPKILYQRYKACEKLLWQYRKSDQGNIQTNLRLGRYDFLLRSRTKGDPTPWKFITPIRIPNTFPKPELNLLKKTDSDREKHQHRQRESSQQEETPQTSSPPQSDYDDYDYSTSASELKLRKAAKHNMSKSPNSQENSPKKDTRTHPPNHPQSIK